MKTKSPWTRESLMLVLSLALAALWQAEPVAAQNSPTPQRPPNVKLSKAVHLTLGVTTVGGLMSALSEQTDLNIRAADYLRERKIIIQMDNTSAETALNDIPELNDWTWSETLPDRILVVRKKLQIDPSPDAIPRSIQAAIPKDIRTYLAIATPEADITKHPPLHDNDAQLKRVIASNALSRTIAMDQAGLLTSLPPGIRNNEPVPYSKLPPLQRSQLLVALVFPLLRDSRQLLRSDALPQVTNVNNAVIRLNGNQMDVKNLVHDSTGDTSFGFSTPFRLPGN